MGILSSARKSQKQSIMRDGLDLPRERESCVNYRRTALTGALPRNTHTHTQCRENAPSYAAHDCKAERVHRDETSRGNKIRRRTELRGEPRAGVNECGLSAFNKVKWLPLCQDLPIPISHYCCEVMKKSPMRKYGKESGLYPMMATMAEESRVRKQAWLRTGCNSFEGKIQSKPMSFWTEQDVLLYIVQNKLDICSVYGDIIAEDQDGNEYDAGGLLMDGCKLRCTGCQRTGCIYCAFGTHLEKGKTRFQRLAETHPRQYEYCMGGGQWVDNPAHDPTAAEWDGEWKNWNPKKIFVPSKDGLGLKTVFDMVNGIYGKDFIRYD